MADEAQHCPDPISAVLDRTEEAIDDGLPPLEELYLDEERPRSETAANLMVFGPLVIVLGLWLLGTFVYV
ncbi:hypothetical protein [Oricola sp.]|uniref:hypothetical protein n=1 Tax=Oricola sp. TaxID=1979950 RepID=UPI0025F997BF|nr:hypothetical protein [Oricola sp.]MCI5076808.1 hypothetical protein [Oricola sp.]